MWSAELGELVEVGLRREGLRAEHTSATPGARREQLECDTGFSAVCQTTACEPYSPIDHSLSTTW